MKKLFYTLWVDAIVFERSNNNGIRNWKIYTLVPMSLYQGLNIFTVLFWLSFFGVRMDVFLDFNIFPSKMLDGALSGLLTLFFPFIILNYLLIFNRRRYEKLIEKYIYKKGKYYKTYAIASVIISVLPLIILKILGMI